MKVNFICDKCKQYSVVCLPNGVVETETLRSGNFYIIFFPAYKSASIVSTEDTEDTDKKILKSFEMEEFTAKDAEYWIKKLKTYVLFQ
ncbi:MAG: hypothetical protein HC877_24140 [Thioploca sp.]|nr:hypothetical protein [Thioploca sp.]